MQAKFSRCWGSSAAANWQTALRLPVMATAAPLRLPPQMHVMYLGVKDAPDSPGSLQRVQQLCAAGVRGRQYLLVGLLCECALRCVLSQTGSLKGSCCAGCVGRLCLAVGGNACVCVLPLPANPPCALPQWWRRSQRAAGPGAARCAVNNPLHCCQPPLPQWWRRSQQPACCCSKTSEPSNYTQQ